MSANLSVVAAEPKPAPVTAETVRRLTQERNAAARAYALALLDRIEGLAQELAVAASLGDAITPGAADLADKLSVHMSSRAETMNAILTKAGKP